MCVLYVWAFYETWREWEHDLRPPKRGVSLAARMLCKLPFLYLLPWALVRFDRHLSARKVNAGLMVVARKC